MKKIFLAVFVLMASGCITPLSQEGLKVRIVDNQSDYNCKFVGTVTASNSMGSSEGHDAEGALNEVRNKAAQASANAIKIINTNTSANATTVLAEALNCEFK